MNVQLRRRAVAAIVTAASLAGAPAAGAQATVETQRFVYEGPAGLFNSCNGELVVGEARGNSLFHAVVTPSGQASATFHSSTVGQGVDATGTRYTIVNVNNAHGEFDVFPGEHTVSTIRVISHDATDNFVMQIVFFFDENGEPVFREHTDCVG